MEIVYMCIYICVTKKEGPGTASDITTTTHFAKYEKICHVKNVARHKHTLHLK